MIIVFAQWSPSRLRTKYRLLNFKRAQDKTLVVVVLKSKFHITSKMSF